MPEIPGLRSPYAKTGRLVYFGRMLDKVRLHAAGLLPAAHVANLGDTKPFVFDARCCRFLGVSYAALRQRTLEGGSDLEVLAWAHATGTPRTDEDCHIWNQFMMKIGWRDDRSAALAERVQEYGYQGSPVQVSFDLLDLDEGRDPFAAKAWELREPRAIVIMGVSGTGKTTIGEKLAARLGWAFRDADGFHPAANVAKMSAGHPLNDEDRAPWLAAIRGYLDTSLARGESVVVTCSALKENYRRAIITDPARIKLVYLKGEYDLIRERMENRGAHFMKAEMLRSQFATLEPPEHALTVDIAEPPDVLVEKIAAALQP